MIRKKCLMHLVMECWILRGGIIALLPCFRGIITPFSKVHDAKVFIC